jgi:hypothetical protein
MAFSFRTPVLDENNFFTSQWQRMLSQIFSGSFADSETPSGTIDGANKVFTLAKTPSPNLSLQLFKGTAIQIQGTDYTVARNVVTFTSAPAALSVLRAWYRY